jgi:hypothetical protein
VSTAAVHDATEADAASDDVARGANIAALMRAVSARGEKRLVCARSQFMKPTMRVGLVGGEQREVGNVEPDVDADLRARAHGCLVITPTGTWDDDRNRHARRLMRVRSS